jgi:hypothetical protein
MLHVYLFFKKYQLISWSLYVSWLRGFYNGHYFPRDYEQVIDLYFWYHKWFFNIVWYHFIRQRGIYLAIYLAFWLSLTTCFMGEEYYVPCIIELWSQPPARLPVQVISIEIDHEQIKRYYNSVTTIINRVKPYCGSYGAVDWHYTGFG